MPKLRRRTLLDQEKPATGYVCADCEFEIKDLSDALIGFRFHDLRHTAVSRMIGARNPIPKIAKMVGWTSGTMVKMAARYGHFDIEDLRDAAESTTAPIKPGIAQEYPQNPPQLDEEKKASVN